MSLVKCDDIDDPFAMDDPFADDFQNPPTPTPAANVAQEPEARKSDNDDLFGTAAQAKPAQAPAPSAAPQEREVTS